MARRPAKIGSNNRRVACRENGNPRCLHLSDGGMYPCTRRLVAELRNHDRTTRTGGQSDYRHAQNGVNAESWPATAAGIGKVLRAARLGRGTSLAEVHAQTGISPAEIRALEDGLIERFPDQITTISYMRQYAWQLGLDGDELTLRLLGGKDQAKHARADHPEIQPGSLGHDRPPAASAQGGVLQATFSREPPISNASHTQHLDDTAAIPIYSFQDTSEIPVVGGAGPELATTITRRRSRKRAPFVLRALVWLCLIVTCLAAGALAINHFRPQWLRSLHLTGSPTARTHTSVTRKPARAISKPAFTKVHSSATSATWSVPQRSFTVTVSATHPCWVAVSTTNSAQSSPAFEGVLQPGQVRSFHANGWLNVRLGAAGATLSISAAGQPIGTLTPPVAPYTFIFSTSTNGAS